MHFDNYDHKFLVDGTRLIFVPTPAARMAGRKLQKQVLRRWTPPVYFYHFSEGGHVAAAKAHLKSHLFARLDIAKFFDHITRGRVHRALRRIGFKHGFAWDAACESTVSKSTTKKSYSLPFGFVQSPVLASLALATSALGAALAELHHGGMSLSVYMDDMLLSGDDGSALRMARCKLEAATEISRFEFNTLKSAGPECEIDVFNLVLSHDRLRVSPERFARFASAIADPTGDIAIIDGILGYVGTVNANQRLLLASV